MQTVREATNPMLYRLLREFDALTGVPILINYIIQRERRADR